MEPTGRAIRRWVLGHGEELVDYDESQYIAWMDWVSFVTMLAKKGGEGEGCKGPENFAHNYNYSNVLSQRGPRVIP